MQQIKSKLVSWQRDWPWPWIVMGLFALGAGWVFVRHVHTGAMPDPVAWSLRVAGFELPVYWYGVLIMGGVVLGAWVMSRLALERAQAIFQATVPATTAALPLSALELPEEVANRLTRQKLTTVGALMLTWGLDRQLLGLNQAGQEVVRAALARQPGVAAAWLEDAPWRQWNPDHIWGGLVWCLILGVIGARLYHVLTPSPSLAAVGINSALDYFQHPMELINIRNGGLGIYGGMVGGLLGLILYARRQRLAWLPWADLAAVGLPLGQFVGRWGNFLNQELYGGPTDLPWGITIDFPLSGLPADARFHPAFLYESLWNLGVFVVLYRLARRWPSRLLPGELTGLYLVLYGVGRIIVDTVRLDNRTVALGGWDIPSATLVSAGLIGLVTLMMLWRRRAG